MRERRSSRRSENRLTRRIEVAPHFSRYSHVESELRARTRLHRRDTSETTRNRRANERAHNHFHNRPTFSRSLRSGRAKDRERTEDGEIKMAGPVDRQQ